MILAELALTFLLSELSYRFIETPIRHGFIGENLRVLKEHPDTKKDRKEKQRTTGKFLTALCCTLLPCIAALLCVIFVPRQNTVNNISALEKQAEEAQKITEKKKKDLTSSKVSSSQEASADSDSAEGGSTKAPKTDEEILQNLHLLLLGDSVALGSVQEFYATFPNSICDAVVSRQAKEALTLYPSYVNDHGWKGDGVILALGTNGLLYDTLPSLREMMGPTMPLFILTIRAPHVSWQDSNNAEIREFVNSHANTYLIDWYAVSNSHNEYFAGDDTHPTQEAHLIYMNTIKEAVLKVYRNTP